MEEETADPFVEVGCWSLPATFYADIDVLLVGYTIAAGTCINDNGAIIGKQQSIPCGTSSQDGSSST